MRVLTYNTAMFYPGYGDVIRADKFRQFLLKGDWDVISLNEVYSRSIRKVLLEDKNLIEKYPHSVYNQASFGKTRFYTFDNGLVLLSKYPILNYKRHEYKEFLDAWYNNLLPKKDALFVEIDHDGLNIGIFITHMQWGRSEEQTKYRYLHMQELREFIEEVWSFDKPLIVMGDLNIFDSINDVDYQQFKKIFPNLKDWHIELNDLTTDPGHTWHRNNSRVWLLNSDHRFDYILSNHFFVPKSIDIVKFKGNRHIHKILWESTNPFTKLEALWFAISLVSRILLSPLIIVQYLVINLVRSIYGSKPDNIFKDKDLSDHYGLEGSCAIIE